MITEKGNSLKHYYEIFGLEEGASLEEIIARWLKFRKQFQLTPEKNDGADKRLKEIKEINEAYRVLKASVPPADEFDLEEDLKKVMARQAGRKAEKKKMVILSSSILAICLIIGASFLILTRSPLTVQLPSTTQSDPNRATRGSIEGPAAISPLESKTPLMVTKIAPQEPNKTAISEVAPPVPISKESPTAFPSGAGEAEEREKLSTRLNLKPAPSVEAAKVIPQEPSKKVVPEGAGPFLPTPPALKRTPPVDVAGVVPQEKTKATIPESSKPASISEEPPAVSIPPLPSPALIPGPLAEEAQVVLQEQSKIEITQSAKIASLPLPPSPFASEREISQFFENYVSRYNSKSVEGLISFFSPKAIQNQKNNLEKIRKIFDHFFDQMETIEYQIVINKIELQQNNLEVRGQYQLEGVVAKGEKRQNWKGQIRWVLVRENGALKILSLDYQPQK